MQKKYLVVDATHEDLALGRVYMFSIVASSVPMRKRDELLNATEVVFLEPREGLAGEKPDFYIPLSEVEGALGDLALAEIADPPIGYGIRVMSLEEDEFIEKHLLAFIQEKTATDSVALMNRLEPTPA